ncbi:MAG: matrixin family metalloprotease [Myxococcota bacterium]
MTAWGHVAAVTAPLLLVAATASAFSVSRTDSNHIIKWYDRDLIINLQVDADGPTRLAPGYTYADVSAAMQSAVRSWNNINCSAIELRITSTTTSTTNAASDGVSGIDGISRAVWIEQAARYPYSAEVLAVTAPVFFQDGTIVEADVIFNGVDDDWAVYANLAAVPGGSTDGQAVDIESVAAHELGHLIGLGHVLDGAALPEPPTMTPTIDPQLRTRTLDQDDQNGACFFYPAGGGTTNPCSSDAQCPELIASLGDSEQIVDRSSCSDGACTKIEDVPCGAGNPGERCCSDNCNSGLKCQSVGGENSYCAASCNTTFPLQCPAGFTCLAFTPGTQGMCISQVLLGCACDTNDDCTPPCACDSDCGSPVTTGGARISDVGCGAGGNVALWSLLLPALLSKRARRRPVSQARGATPS